MKNEITEIKVTHRSILKSHLHAIQERETMILDSLSILEDLEKSNVMSEILEYRPRNSEFSNLPSSVQIGMPTFHPTLIKDKHIVKLKLFGSLTPMTIRKEENGYKIKSRPILDEPEVINTFNTGYQSLRSLLFYSDDEVWTSSTKCELKCFNSAGKCINTIATKSGDLPNDVAITNDRHLVYSDWKSQTVNKVADGSIEEILRLQGWIPFNLCFSSSGALLVVFYNEEKTKSKVVCHFSNDENQTIQFDEKGKPLYSGNSKVKYITENKNMDICVADSKAGVVVVVNQSGKLRFRYSGRPSKVTKKTLKPFGITTNRQSQILIADGKNHCIHILNQDGQFLSYIHNLKIPFGLCVDKLNNLLVAEFFTGDVKVIRYLE